MTDSDPFRFHEPPRPCSYLPAETAALEYRFFREVSPERMSQLLRRGWRRMGIHFFRPRCPQCTRCRSLRVDVEAFQPTKSQRRCLSKNTEIRCEPVRPGVSAERIALYNAYHADMHERRGWPEKGTTADEYAESFLTGGWDFAYELQYREGADLVGLGLIDVVPDALSSIYFYHAPRWRDRGPGTFTILQEIELARRLGKRWLYLGYWIAECQSMAYKNAFGPHQILRDYITDQEEPIWEAPAAASESP